MANDTTLRIAPFEYNGFVFQRENVSADFETPYDWGINGLISTNNTQRNQNFPKYSGKVYSGEVKVVNVTLNDVIADRNDLVKAMDIRGSEQHALYGLDQFGKKWYVDCVCVGLNYEVTEGNTASFGLIFECDDPAWIKADDGAVTGLTTDTWAITASGQTRTMSVGGNQPARPKFSLTPTSSLATYYPNKQYIKNYNPLPVAQTDGIDITGTSGWDTATLVAAGKMLASGDDVLVYVDGKLVPRWVGGGGWDNAVTRIFIRLTWQPGQFMPLRTAVAGSGTPARLEFAKTTAVRAAIAKLPKIGILRFGNEEFSYNGKVAGTSCYVNVVERSIRGTSIASHAVGVVGWWVEHDIKIIYGNSLATPQTYSDLYKPVFDLTTSTILSRVYTSFADTANLRAGAWKRNVINDGIGKLNRVYSDNQGSDTEVDPATDMGMEIDAYQAEGRWKPETAELSWQLYHPAGITVVTSNGEKYKALATTTWPTKANLESSPNGVKWVQEWNEAVPGSANTWTAWTHNSEAVPTGTKYVRFHFQGSVDADTNNLARYEVDGATITVSSSGVIQVAMNGEIAGMHFDSEIENVTKGQKILIDYPVSQGNTLIIDTENMEATYRGMNAIRGISLDSVRTEWLEVDDGDVLKYTENTPTGNVTLVTQHRDKSM